MDHEALLTKYMQHIVDCESVDYLGYIGVFHSDVVFTPEELTELKRISEQLQEAETQKAAPPQKG